MGCTSGAELASGDNFRVPPCASKNDGITFLAGYLPACQVTRCWTSTNQAPIGVSQDSEDIHDSNHLDLSSFAIRQLE